MEIVSNKIHKKVYDLFNENWEKKFIFKKIEQQLHSNLRMYHITYTEETTFTNVMDLVRGQVIFEIISK
jgi:hypothetical protein